MDVQSSMTEQNSGRPLVLAETVAKVEQDQEMLEDRHVTACELYERIPEVRVRLGMWQESSMTRVNEKCHSVYKSASIAMMISLKNS